jgi:hypothetical protein
VIVINRPENDGYHYGTDQGKLLHRVIMLLDSGGQFADAAPEPTHGVFRLVAPGMAVAETHEVAVAI